MCLTNLDLEDSLNFISEICPLYRILKFLLVFLFYIKCIAVAYEFMIFYSY